MPSRWQCLLIILFWLGTTAWLYIRELEPIFREHDPPPYAIELTAETQLEHPPVLWRVLQNGQEHYHAKTWMDHCEEDDSFTLHAVIDHNPRQDEKGSADLIFRKLESGYRVSREGILRELNVSCTLASQPTRLLPDFGFYPEFRLNGVVQDGRFTGRVKLPKELSGLLDAESEFQFPVAHNGAIFLPLHPVNKIHGVQPGKTWRVPRIDPLVDALKAWVRKFQINLPDSGERFLDARVEDQPKLLPYDLGDSMEHHCLVINYRSKDAEDEVATTWVEVDTDQVLCQEVTRAGGNWRLIRDSARSKIR